MNKQYVGNDFAKAQTTDKLTPEKVGREISLHSYHCYSYHSNSSHVNFHLFVSLYCPLSPVTLSFSLSISSSSYSPDSLPSPFTFPYLRYPTVVPLLLILIFPFICVFVLSHIVLLLVSIHEDGYLWLLAL